MNTLWISLLIAATAAADTAFAPPPVWDDATVRLFATLPLQSGGRVMPLDTYAGFTLLQVNGRRKCQIGPAELPGPLGRMVYPSRTSVPWFLDCLFYPEEARAYPSFLVSNSDVFMSMGAAPLERKRGRFTYNALLPAQDRIFSLASEYANIPVSGRDFIQRETLRVAEGLNTFDHVTGYLDFARHSFTLPNSQVFAELFPGRTEVSLSEALAKGSAIQRRFQEMRSGDAELDKNQRDAEREALRTFYSQLESVHASSGSLALFPGTEHGAPWLSVADVIERALAGDIDTGPYVQWIAQLETLVANRDNRPAFFSALKEFHDSIAGLAEAHGEYGRIELEVAYYHANLFYRGLVFYILAFVLVALSWLAPRNRPLRLLTPVAITLPTVLLIAGIVLRCIIRGRPPVTTLYETILFVTAVSVVLALFMEYVSRQRVALAVGSVLGVLGMLLANKYEVSSAEDTMPTMAAVLDTNFWLAAHVTTIIVGYAATLLTGALAHIYILGRLAGFKKNDDAFYPGLTRMVYGMFCFGFYFTFMGTVLGGIWANESWGRFWGWDPKENGALLICLWQLAILHARLGGHIRDLGINLAAVVGAAIVAFSWWGVNLLGVGLHSYGFTSGAMTSLVIYWGIEAFVLFLGGLIYLRGRRVAPKVLST